ncbi:hypothetical protein ACFSTE_21695 [Aquimarina hainanensis]|uniref:Uncharacterized protein n=1 Tax=Aquimarina hainanensis TaxID=1578017 RepID=A0ABW5NEC3_9FLAO|nr:hypothetical protein [Aquimarina sp. TRL1]QKX07321.1 hypothetical protein HN014_21200 [Aquimarina sp. TRL1]
MAQIKNIEGLTTDQINQELVNGARFIVFQYCISIILMTFRKNTAIYFIKKGESTIKYSIGWTLLSFFIGWWGIPWGPIYTISSLYTNIRGGKDVTEEVLSSMQAASQSPAP